MGKVAFFPWFDVKEPLECADFVVLPYRRGLIPGANPAEQAALDLVIGRYKEANGEPVRRASVLQHITQRTPTDPVDEDYHLDLFVFADLLAFAGLAGRQFFGHFEYSNRDHYRLVLQQFTDGPERGVLLTTRRKDGSTNAFYTGGVFAVYRPHHVHQEGTSVDLALLRKLMEAIGDQESPELYQAVVLFNEANTDRLEIHASTELILTYAAFEQALGVPGKQTDKVASAFSDTMVPRRELARSRWTIHHGNPRAERLLSNAPSLRNAWFQDLANSRGSLAHGHADGAYPACWSPPEHLLLAAHALPLVVKCRLSSMVGYDLTPTDKGGVEVFERLLNVRHLEPNQETRLSKHPWRKIMGRQRMREGARLAEGLFQIEDDAHPEGGEA